MTRPLLSEDLTPISDFRTRTAEIVEKVQKTRRPVVLTHHGRAAAVLEDVREYEIRVERLELLEAIVEGLRAAEKGALIPHSRAMADLRKVLRG